jgi:hypothetical protein
MGASEAGPIWQHHELQKVVVFVTNFASNIEDIEDFLLRGVVLQLGWDLCM